MDAHFHNCIKLFEFLCWSYTLRLSNSTRSEIGVCIIEKVDQELVYDFQLFQSKLTTIPNGSYNPNTDSKGNSSVGSNCSGKKTMEHKLQLWKSWSIKPCPVSRERFDGGLRLVEWIVGGWKCHSTAACAMIRWEIWFFIIFKSSAVF